MLHLAKQSRFPAAAAGWLAGWARCCAEEWRHLAGMHADKASLAALVLGAVVLAPLTEVQAASTTGLRQTADSTQPQQQASTGRQLGS